MAVADVSPGNQYPVGAQLKCLEDEIWIDPAGTHYPDNPHIGRVLKTAHACQIRSRIGAPVAGKGNDPRTKLLSHKILLRHLFYSPKAASTMVSTSWSSKW